jgi:hypothetical protein
VSARPPPHQTHWSCARWQQQDAIWERQSSGPESASRVEVRAGLDTAAAIVMSRIDFAIGLLHGNFEVNLKLQ